MHRDYVNLRLIYVNMRLNYVYCNLMAIVIIIISHVVIILLHILLHIDIIYLVRREGSIPMKPTMNQNDNHAQKRTLFNELRVCSQN